MRRWPVVVSAVLTCLALTAPRAEEEAPKGFTPWLNEALAKRVAVAVSTRSNSNQAEAPSAASNSSSLVDTSSASDLIGAALNLADLSGGTADSDAEDDATTGTVTASAYVLWTAAKGQNPLDPGVYCGTSALGPAAWWRSVSFTLGFDDQDEGNTGQESPIVAGTKLVLWTERDICDPGNFDKVQGAIETAAARVSAWTMRVQDLLYARWLGGGFKDLAADEACKPKDGDQAPDPSRVKVLRDCKINFLNALRDGTTFQGILSEVGSDALTGQIRDEELRDLVNLDVTAREAIDEFRQQPQLAVNFTTKQREEDGLDEYRSELVLDIGLNDRLTLTGNGSWEVKDGDDAQATGQGHGQGARIASALQFEPFKDPLFGPKPLRISLGGEGKWAERAEPTYKGQLKLNLPIPRVAWLTGVELPISLTIANRSELVDESEVKGLVGFTIDTSQLLHAVQ